MKTSGDFTVHQYSINFRNYNEPIYLIPFGDIHRSSPHCSLERWKEFLGWAKKKDNCYFLGMGDYDDLVSTTERNLIHTTALHDSTLETLEDMYIKFTDELADEISFMKGRLIGLIEGNHYAQLKNGTTTTQYLCQKLDTHYLGCNTFIRLVLKYDKNHTHKVDIWAHHGLGGGRTAGSSINKVEQMTQVSEADIYLMGHDHQKSVDFKSRLYLSEARNTEPEVKHRRILLARTGSFLRGYVANKASYIVDKAMPPTDLGVIKIELTPKRWKDNKVETREIGIHASI